MVIQYKPTDLIHGEKQASFLTGHSVDIDRGIPKLSEVTRAPQISWKRADLAKYLRDKRVNMQDAHPLGGGRAVLPEQMILLGPYTESLFSDIHLSEGLAHLGYSRVLFYGVAASDYKFHYQKDRRSMTRQDMQEAYYEHWERYELAFISAFKGIERLLRVGQIKRDAIEAKLLALGYAGIAPNTIYRRQFEVFSGLRRRTSFAEIIGHFLDICDVVGAHANPNAPRKFILSEDSVFEIQLFLETFCIAALRHIKGRSLPDGAIADLNDT